jgi:hypothetical protein
MKFARDDWKKIRTPAVIFSLAFILMGSLVYFAHLRKEASVFALRNQKAQLQEATRRYQLSGAEKNSIIKYLPQYQQLINKGVVGEERRLEWVDALRNVHKNQKLFTIKYGIGAQELYKPIFSINSGQFKITRSLMKLELAMLHEGDLLILFDSFTEQKTSPFIVRQCEITRQNANIGSSLTPNMLAKCELDWITIHEPINVATVSLTSTNVRVESP